jgi:hypothetical protein
VGIFAGRRQDGLPSRLPPAPTEADSEDRLDAFPRRFPRVRREGAPRPAQWPRRSLCGEFCRGFACYLSLPNDPESHRRFLAGTQLTNRGPSQGRVAGGGSSRQSLTTCRAVQRSLA